MPTETKVGLDATALVAFVLAQIEKVRETPLPGDLASILDECETETGRRPGHDETLALWLAAGLASQIGLVLITNPGRFITGYPEGEPERQAALGLLEGCLDDVRGRSVRVEG